ncbi:MAG: hypothetical protein JWR83_2952, partial [Aeromicrobium sp.]|nr:hypothetical protein [Aeromicrobium sp.]
MPTESDTSGNEPNLELPNLSLGFGRKKRRDPKAAAPAADAPASEDVVEEDTAEQPAPAVTVEEPVVE